MLMMDGSSVTVYMNIFLLVVHTSGFSIQSRLAPSSAWMVALGKGQIDRAVFTMNEDSNKRALGKVRAENLFNSRQARSAQVIKDSSIDTDAKDMKKTLEKEDDIFMTSTPSLASDEDDSEEVFRNFNAVGRSPTTDRSSKEDKNHNLQDPEGAFSSSNTGISSWVFITIGASVVMLIAITVALTLLYRRRQRSPLQVRNNAKPPEGGPTGLNYDTQRSGSTDKGTEKSRSTVSTYLSKDTEQDEAECHELLPLNALRSPRERTPVNDLFSDRVDRGRGSSNAPLRNEILCRAEVEQPLPQVVVRNLSSGAPSQSLFGSCVRSDEIEDAASVSARSFLSRQRDDGNKLRGGNGDFQRRYVDVDYVHNDFEQSRFRHRKQNASSPEPDYYRRRSRERISSPSSSDSQPGTLRSYKDRGRNESNASSSTSHHSARSYISIPPTSPSENYIEAGSDDMSMRSERSTPPIRMEWLTKNVKVDAKNELRNYHSSSATQTDSDVSGPKCKTVFGTAWQFGGTFNSRGGMMQAKDSDVSLFVVADAILKGEYVDIFGAVFTDTTEIRRKFDFPAEESLITPVVEYHASPSHSFARPVSIQLPHALPEEFDAGLIKVYTFTVDERRNVSLCRVPMKSRSNDDRDPNGYWEKGRDGCSIEISTTHFSGYFCTMCETSSLPSICTMVFGSHVQITESRREVRVILYIWDRRLTIKDYLERFRKQESDVDRQLLTDMQVPLLDSASSDSRLVMRMEVMGEDDDRHSWRHVYRPDGSRPLFKPLQVRKLSEIVHCCRQTDPIRVEWALENAPQQIPSSVFQCCIDIMHVHESTRDYETAMREDNDDLMRTFYVRDLKVLNQAPQELKPNEEFRRSDLKRTLSEALDMADTERICQEYGISIKDIGNFRKKYSSQEQFQVGLVEECIRRHGQDGFLKQLPEVLEKLHMTRALSVLEDRKILVRDLTEFEGVSSSSSSAQPKQASQTVVAKPPASVGGSRDSTTRKSLYGESSHSPNRRNRSNSPSYRRRSSREDQRRSQRPTYHNQTSNRSDDVFVHNQPPPPNGAPAEERQSRDRGRRQDAGESNRSERRRSPPCDYSDDERDYVRDRRQTKSKYTTQEEEERQPLKGQKSSSSGSDSVLRDSSLPSRDNAATTGFSSRSTLGYSMLAQADPKDFAEPYPEEFLDDLQQQTYKKELAVQQNLHGPNTSQDFGRYPVDTRKLHLSDSGPQAIPPEPGQGSSSSSSDAVSFRRNRSPHSVDKDQTSKKELYGIHTLV